MIKYGKNKIFNPSFLHKLNIDRQSVDAIPHACSVLEIGCATGFVGRYLIKHKKCKVVGIELGIDEAREARKVLHNVYAGDIEDPKVLNLVTEKFDVVYASALLEHLKDPWKALKDWRRFLKKNGLLIITTSNIVHWSQRINFVKGNFEYKDYGLLDNTHLRFFTTKTFPKLVLDSGYKIEKFSIDPVGGGHPKVSTLLSRFFPNLFAYQMLIIATPNGR